MTPEKMDLMNTPHLGLRLQGLSVSSQRSSVGLSICSHLVKEKAFLVMPEQDNDQ